MNIKEANKIIVRYMGFSQKGGPLNSMPDFTKSLDSLVPVWKKIGFMEIEITAGIGPAKGQYFAALKSYLKSFDGGEQNTIQEAAAIATARAIEGVQC